MKRITVKDSNGCIDCGGTMAELWQEEYRKRYATRSIQAGIKLCQLEDVEEELGIDLITLFKALNDGAWFKIGNRFYTDIPNLIRDIGQFTLQVPYHGFVNVKDYGKTWALTKEELE